MVDSCRSELYTILQAIHLRGVVHGDVEPRNVVIEDDRRVTLVDFDSADRHHACPGGLQCFELSRLARAFEAEPAPSDAA
jgi:DNA-binding helix-hairpin-helix protein with protein kinase domain